MPPPGQDRCPRARRVAALQQARRTRDGLGLRGTRPGGDKEAGAAEASITRSRKSTGCGNRGLGPTRSWSGKTSIDVPDQPRRRDFPVVERIAPERLAEVFWRAVALHPRIEQDMKKSFVSRISASSACYSRGTTARLPPRSSSRWMPICAHSPHKGPQFEFNPPSILGKGCIDPRSAVALLESLTPSREFTRNNPVHDARLTLAEALGLPSERWRRLCSARWRPPRSRWKNDP